MDDGRPPFDVAAAEAMIGKYILVGFTDLDTRGELIGYRQIHGVITATDVHRGVCIELKGVHEGEVYWLPPDLRSFKKTEPGTYRLRSTGEVIDDPDLLCKWIQTDLRSDSGQAGDPVCQPGDE